MNVWIESPFDNLPAEGYRKQRYWLMAEAFARAGHSVVYWTSDFSHANKDYRRKEMAGCRESGIVVRYIRTIPYRNNVSLSRVRSHRAYAREWLSTVDAMTLPQDAPPAIVIASCPPLSAAAAAISVGSRFGAKVVVDVQDAWPETFERLAPRCFRWLARLILMPLRLKARRIYRSAHLVTGVCDGYRALTGRDDYYRAYLGVDGDDVRNCPSVGDNRQTRSSVIRLVYAGGLGRTYDLKTLVRVVDENSDMTLDVAGFGTFPFSCPRVRFHGALTGEKLQALFASCDIGVIPMGDDSVVGLPNKMFDYAAAGLGIVSSLSGESAILLKKYACGAIYQSGDIASLAEAIRRVSAFECGLSRRLYEDEFVATRIYDAYVRRVCHA